MNSDPVLAARLWSLKNQTHALAAATVRLHMSPLILYHSLMHHLIRISTE
jgi:hypothetical protein